MAQENAWKCIPRSEGVPVAKPKDGEKRARGKGSRDRGRDWDAEDIIRVEKPTPRTITEKLCLILPTGPASAIVILHFAPLRLSLSLSLCISSDCLRLLKGLLSLATVLCTKMR